MFGNKKNTVEGALGAEVAVQSMPKEFYGGANPVVVFHDVKKEVSSRGQPVSSAERAAFNKTTAVGSGAPLHLSNLLTSRRFLIMGGVALFVLFGAGAGVYYWYQGSKTTDQNYTAPPVLENIVPEVANNISPEIPAIIPEPVSTTTPEIAPVQPDLLEFPDNALSDSADMDKDGLSDSAEELFGTDPALPDSDNDSYSDAHEIFYLYNPAGKEPMKLIDAGVVKEYANPVFNYSIFYPIDWAVGNTKEDYRDILFSAIGGDNIEILAVDKDPSMEFSIWLAEHAKSEQMSNYVPFESRFGVTGFERADKLVYFLVAADRIYALAYHAPDSGVASYRIALNMIARSFAISATAGNMMPMERLDALENTTTTDETNVASSTSVSPVTTTSANR